MIKAKESIIDYLRSMEKLVKTMQELSMADSLDQIMSIVKIAARELSVADGVSFVLREAEQCFYADESTISPLWKGKKLPLTDCIAGWSIINRSSTVIEDVYKDERIKKDLYKNTFVRSLLVIPVKTINPIGAIICYWANYHKPTIEKIKIIQALADITAITIENIRVYSILETHVEKRTKELEDANRKLELANQSLATANQDLEAFSYTLSHDLKEPLNIINGFSRVVLEKHTDALDDKAKNYLTRVCNSAERMNLQIDTLLDLHKLSERELKQEIVDLSEISKEIIFIMKENEPTRQVKTTIEKDLITKGDKSLLYLVMQNLLSNAWKYSSKSAESKIKVGVSSYTEKDKTFFVQDNGVGFDKSKAQTLFSPFQRMHSQKDFPGTGVGLTSVRRIITRHGGKIWIDSIVDKGTTVYFSLPK
ncbi:MAG: GHKL domain-containing protein [Acidobacteria bacterium]|nr:GHKL domain-containing protein [Acidobacteriota bacterium]